MKKYKFYNCEICGKEVFKDNEYENGIIKIMEIKRTEKVGIITGPHNCSHNVHLEKEEKIK